MDKQELQSKIGERVKQLRLERKISQVDLASACNFEKSNMSRLEAGNTNPTAYTLHIIAQKLEIETFEILKFKTISE